MINGKDDDETFRVYWLGKISRKGKRKYETP